ncbi:T9SS type A sorting domain-containing protein [Flavobacterium sp.]|uniref:T9SS type A sorting domain-containing protein n=1 Tax=Flavobacterium sp. TaxID=239 RepID=UPI0026253170|nr:T9SS type A sorting domain-containing protein [Flavobacterium sp.]
MKKILLSISMICGLTAYAQQDLLWVKRVGNSSQMSGVINTAITTDPDGNVITGGLIDSDTDFDMGDGESILTAEFITGYVAKYNNDGNLIWANKLDGVTQNNIRLVSTDANGNVYVSGLFSGICDFDPGPSAYLLEAVTEPSERTDLFIAKYDPEGNLLWAKDIDAPQNNIIDGRTMYADGTGVYISGSLIEITDFNPDEDEYNVEPIGINDSYLLKLSSDGDFEWVQNYGSVDNIVVINSIYTDSNNIYLGGGMRGEVDFDSSGETAILTGTDPDFFESFLVKLDITGNYIWAKKFDSEYNNNIINAIAGDSEGNIYAGGHFESPTDFNPGTDVFTLETVATDEIQMFVTKLSDEGDLEWVKTIESNEGGSVMWGIAVNDSDNIYISGNYNGNINFIEGEQVMGSEANEDFFIAGMDNSGNYLWQKSITSDIMAAFANIAADNAGNIFCSGSFLNNIQFSDGTEFNMEDTDAADMFLAKYINSSTNIRESLLSEEFVVYPNPSFGDITIEHNGSLTGSEMSVYNQLGQEVKVITISNNIINLELSAGIYILKADKGNESFTYKLIIK